jgi:hypothetical protein
MHEASAAFPRRKAASLAASVGDLNCGDGAHAMNEIGNASQRLNVAIVIDAHVTGSDTALRSDCAGFDENESGAARRSATEMYEVPIVGESIDRGILAHGRNDDPVSQSHATNGEGGQKIHLGSK